MRDHCDEGTRQTPVRMPPHQEIGEGTPSSNTARPGAQQELPDVSLGSWAFRPGNQRVVDKIGPEITVSPHSQHSGAAFRPLYRGAGGGAVLVIPSPHGQHRRVAPPGLPCRSPPAGLAVSGSPCRETFLKRSSIRSVAALFVPPFGTGHIFTHGMRASPAHRAALAALAGLFRSLWSARKLPVGFSARHARESAVLDPSATLLRSTSRLLCYRLAQTPSVTG
jgi:hypothetical protein